MPTFEITSPDGKKYRVTAPDGATQEQVLSYAQSQFKTAKPETYDPTEGMSGLDKFRAGMGKFPYDVARGLGQKLGIVDQKSIDEARALDAPLMKTGAGSAGNIAGAIGFGAPSMLIPGANTVAGTAATGAVMSGLMPTSGNESAVKNALEGAAWGAGGQLAGKALGYGYRAAKSAAEPFTNKGQEAILGRLLNKTAGGGQFADDAATAMRTAQPLVPGSIPTMAEAAQNPGLAALQRTATATQPEVAAEMAQRFANQNQARATALGDIADPSKLAFFEASRKTAANGLYKTAMEEIPVATPWIKGQLTALEKRPAFRDAVVAGKERALNKGFALDENNVTQVVHYAKKELDSAISKATRAGEDASGLIGTRDKLVSLIESKDFSPSYREARTTFAEMSKPINEIQTAMAIQKGATNSLTDQIMPQKFAQLMGDQTAQRATGFGKATMENTMSPEALQTLQSIQADLARSQFAQNAGRGPGSDSIQKLAYSNMIDAAGVPSFLRNMGAGQLAGNLLTRGADAVYGRANRELANRLAQLGLNPQEAARIMQMPQTALPEYLRLSQGGGLLGATIPAGLLGNSGQ